VDLRGERGEGKVLLVGRVVKPHGVRGELVVDVRTDEPEDRFAVGRVLRGRMPKAPRGQADQNYTVTAARQHAGRLLLSLAEVTGREGADAVRGLLLLIDTADLTPSDDPDEFYDHELEGVPVRLVGGDDVGTVTEVLHLPGGDVLSVRTADGRDVLVPFVTEMVPTVSTELIEIDPPDGLLDDA